MLPLRDITSCSSATALSSLHPLINHSLISDLRIPKPTVSRRTISCALRVDELSTSIDPSESKPAFGEVLRLITHSNEDDLFQRDQPRQGLGQEVEEEKLEGEEEEEEEEEGKGISKIRVSRQKYIPVSKAELLDAILFNLFHSRQDDDAPQFLLLSSCLDSILHAEHKGILEEMRIDYSLIESMGNKRTPGDEVSADSYGNAVDEGKVNAESVSDQINGIESMGEFGGEVTRLRLNYVVDSGKLLASPTGNGKRYSDENNRLAVATRFQRSFMQLLDNAQFQELSARDLILTSALNSDYLLTLPIYVDWKKASESNAIIFRRGYAMERQKGLLIVEKLDYLQSRLLQKVFLLISKPLGKIGKWIKETIHNAFQRQEGQNWAKRIINWLEELSLFQQSYFSNDQTPDNLLGIDQLSDRELPIWLAAQRAVSRYEGFLSPVGPRGRLFRRLLTWVGLVPPIPETTFDLEADDTSSEPHLRPIFLSRISLSDIWRPATRKYCGNNIWKMIRTSFSIFLSQSVLQEPAFQELILLYTKEANESDSKDKAEVSSLQLKIYERIPIPDLPVVFPDKKLSFRIIDTVRLDGATILGLLAFFINYKFEDILSSPSAIFLDVVAITALIIYVTRVALGYKQTWDRYQLLVNKTLYEKTLASGFGSVHFLLDASEQQQYKEAILTYAVLLKVKKGPVTCCRSLGHECERFLYDMFKVKVEMPVDKALSTLARLGLVVETPNDARSRIRAIPCGKAHEALKERWNSLLC